MLSLFVRYAGRGAYESSLGTTETSTRPPAPSEEPEPAAYQCINTGQRGRLRVSKLSTSAKASLDLFRNDSEKTRKDMCYSQHKRYSEKKQSTHFAEKREVLEGGYQAIFGSTGHLIHQFSYLQIVVFWIHRIMQKSAWPERSPTRRGNFIMILFVFFLVALLLSKLFTNDLAILLKEWVILCKQFFI